MAKFTLDDLNRIIETYVDVDAQVAENALDTSYSDLGMDSLGVIELVERIHLGYRVPVPTDTIEELRTPRLTIDYVNEHLAEGHGADGDR